MYRVKAKAGYNVCIDDIGVDIDQITTEALITAEQLHESNNLRSLFAAHLITIDEVIPGNPATYKSLTAIPNFIDHFEMVDGELQLGDKEIKLYSEGANILTFAIEDQVGETVIVNNSTTHTIGITLPAETVVTALKPTFTLSEGAKAVIGSTEQVSGTTENDFTTAKVYKVTSEDGETTINWTVTVTVAS